MNTARILVIEDDTRSAQSLERLLKSQGYAVTLCHRGDEGFERASKENFDLIITDFRLPGVDGLELIRQLHAEKPRLPMVLMTAFGTTETAIEATKHGAFEYVLKPFDVAEMLEVVKRAVASARLMSGHVELGADADQPATQAIAGNSRAMQAVYKEIGRVAATAATVLIRGETGTGKELVARAIYQHSERATTPFIAVNCAAIPETLLESELFGHERGAFTGADARRIGRFEQAHAGTLLLDEIGDMTAFTQAKLLRVLQDKVIQRIGGKENIPVDVRIIAATHQNLERLIAEGKFREDLYYRLNVISVTLPPLRERKEDLFELALYFLGQAAERAGKPITYIDEIALEAMSAYHWPGNIRELQNVIERAVVLCEGRQITIGDLPHAVAQATFNPATSTVPDSSESRSRTPRLHAESAVSRTVIGSDSERQQLVSALARCNGNKAEAARILGIPRSTFFSKLRRHGLG